MNSRERVNRAVEFGGPDRVPIMHTALPAAYLKHGQPLVDLLNEFPDDFGGHRVLSDMVRMGDIYRRGLHTDDWGCAWNNEQEGILGICVGHPLEDWSNWTGYKLPDISPLDPQRVQKGLQENHERYAFGFGTNIFERMQWLRGYETLMFDLALRSPEAFTLRDAIVEWAVENARLSATTDVDGMHFGDDWGTQIALIISPGTWREFFKPAYKAMFEPAKAAGKHIHFHSDGFTWEILPDLLEVGVDVLNIQHSVMGLDVVAKEFGGKVAFRSDLDRQHILPNGSPREVREHVKEVIGSLGSYGGGLIGHGEIAHDVPLENVRAMLEAFHEFGGY